MIGSTWGKWDIHLHSPLTNLANDYRGLGLDEYAQKIKSECLSLIGVTNYFYFKENELELIRAALRKVGAETVVLGNIEIRLTQPNKSGEWINLHIIFAEHIETKVINELLSKVQVTNTTVDGRTIWCSEASFNSSGVNAGEVVVDKKAILDLLSKNLCLGKDYLVAMCPNGYGGFQPDKTEGRSVAIALEIDKTSQIILGRPRDRTFFLSVDRYTNAAAKPVFHCSDAHSLESIGGKYTWVKSLPSFQGLRQTVFEPTDRVQQTDDFIEKSFIKPHFSRIIVRGEVFPGGSLKFSEQVIPLNSNMVAIIGGRGTGKSLLLDALFSRLDNCPGSEKVRGVNVKDLSIILNTGGPEGTEIEFNGSSDDSYSYLHVSQGNIHSFSKDAATLSDEIKRMLGIRFVEYDTVATQELNEILGGYRAFVEYWRFSDSAGVQINNPKYQEAIVSKNTQLLGTLTNPQNNALIQRYQANSSVVNEKIAFIGRGKEILSEIQRSVEQINIRISEYNSYRDAEVKIPFVSVDAVVSTVNQNETTAGLSISESGRDNEAIKSEFARQGINQDISSLLSKVSEYQYAIDQAKNKIAEIELRTKEYHGFVQRRGDLSAQYSTYVERMRVEVDSAFARIQQQNPDWNQEQNDLVQHILSDINIIGVTVFDLNVFYSGLERCVNRGKFRSSSDKTSLEKMIATFGVREKEDFFRLLSGQKVINIEGELLSIEDFFWRDEFFNQGGRYELMNYLFSPASIKLFLYVKADFTYKGKPVDKLSVGQRGTFYVCLKLATDPFGSPFVFDQPEDDLDNEFIVNQLVPLFNVIKKYRQVVIVTHNANLVVNADAEQVLVACNDGEIISYTGGALEEGDVRTNDGVRSKVCSILEGGHTAFEKREKKYCI
ncbi:TrlF family AAA-like ATPase [Pseudomonas entomophila]|uniref:TrlF family AAA-like ATPase n=1 Tax=Pseudomonas entomophila TaxID=312306 RepID=UPI001F01CA64|nr:ATP-binding protein [Pseudomonas entomophila]MCG8294151.1 ATP-binding protein [Pseudomonas entomophila]